MAAFCSPIVVRPLILSNPLKTTAIRAGPPSPRSHHHRPPFRISTRPLRIVSQPTCHTPAPKFLAYTLAAFLLTAPTLPVHSSPLNSDPLRFSQSLFREDPHAPAKLRPRWDFKSVNSQTETFVMFSNETSSVVDLWWVDYFGREVYYGSILPNTVLLQQSYATHPWVVRDHISQNAVLIFVADTEPALAIVDNNI